MPGSARRRPRMERRDKGKDSAALRWLWRGMSGYRLRGLLLIVLNALSALISVLMALVSRELIDSTTVGDAQRLMASISMMLAVFGINLVISLGGSVLVEYLTGRLSISMQQRMLATLYEKSYAEITRFHSGELLNRLFSDVNVVVGGMLSLLPAAASLTFRLVGAAAALLVLAPQLVAIFATVGVAMFLVMTFMRGLLKSLHKRAQETAGEVRSFLQEAVGSLLVVKVFRAEGKILKRAAEFHEKNFKVRMKRRMVSLFGGAGFGLIVQAGYFLTMVWGCWQVLTGAFSFGTMTATLQLVSQVQSPFSGFSNLLAQYFSVLASAERLMELEDLEDEAHLESGSEALPKAREKLYRELREIVFEHVDFSYGRNPVLIDAGFRIQKGDFVSVTGRSGGGKSTVFYLLLGAWRPTGGRIRFYLDGERPELEPGQDVRKLFAYVPQGNYLFSGTLRENVTFFSPEIQDELVWEALKIACAEPFVRELPQGLDTRLGEHGYGLSEGQMQRIAVARAILSGAPVLLLDEATSALDEATEAQLLKNIAELKNRTCIIVTHRKAALDICNRHLEICDAHVSE